MDRLAALVKNRLVLDGAPPHDAPYLAREAIAFGRAVGITSDGDIVRLAVITRALSAVAPEPRAVALAVLTRRDLAPWARLDFIERTWLDRAPGAGGG